MVTLRHALNETLYKRAAGIHKQLVYTNSWLVRLNSVGKFCFKLCFVENINQHNFAIVVYIGNKVFKIVANNK